MIRKCNGSDVLTVSGIINDSALAYKGVIPSDCWHEPYMPLEELIRQINDNIAFYGFEVDGELAGVMGLQTFSDVSLIRHAYVRTAMRRRGIGGKLIGYLKSIASNPLLIGTWAAATWAVRFYEQHEFKLVTAREKDILLRKYWTIPDRQVETSMVLADQSWFDRQAKQRGL